MAKNYYLDTNILVKYSCFQEYLVTPEYGVKTVRDLINRKEDNFYLSHLTLWEFHQVFLKKYRTNEKWKVFGETTPIRYKTLNHLFFELKGRIENGFFRVDNSAISPEVFIKSERLMLKYIGEERRALDSIDALHIALVKDLIKTQKKEITLICADKLMSEIAEQEGLSVFFVHNKK